MESLQLKSKHNFKGKQKHYEGTYSFFEKNGECYLKCDIYGQCISAPTVYTSNTNPVNGFTMTARGKMFNATYYLDDSDGNRFATITRKGIGFRWKILDRDDNEVARVIDPASRKEAFFRDLLAAGPDSYVVISNDRPVAVIQNEQLAENLRTRPGNILGRLLDKTFGQSALTLTVEPEFQNGFDARLLIAAMTLLREHDILGVNRG